MLENLKNKKWILWVSHLLVWTVLLGLPYLLAWGGEPFNPQRLLKYSTVPLVYYAIIFYTNYLVLIDRFLFTPIKLPFFLFNSVLIGILVAVSQYIKNLYFPAHVHANDPRPPFQFYAYIDMLSMLIPLLFSIGLKTFERWVLLEARHQQATQEKLISELQHLKYQLQPHFFFNSLNNIYSLIDLNPDRAKETVHSLAKLMRYLLYETNAPYVNLYKETDFMKKYIELMQLRTSEHATITVEFPEAPPQIQVAPLLFITLIENAFKHGVSATTDSDLSFKMEVDEQKITFTSRNLNLPKDSSDLSGSGIGLENMTKRLALLYPQSHDFKIDTEGTYYTSTLSIQYQKTKI